MVIPIEPLVQVAYLDSLTLQFLVAFDSNGSHSDLESLTDYEIEFSSSIEDRIIHYNRSDIEIISNSVLQLTIPQANTSHAGEYTLITGDLNM